MEDNRSLKYIKSIITIGLVAIFTYYLTSKLIGGARWSSGLPLGGADNYLDNGGSLYTILKDGMTPGSSYFPGVVLLSLLYRIIFGYGAETAIIITGAIIGVLILICFSNIASNEKKEHFWLFTCASIIMIIGFPSAKSYLLEMHPDIPALMFFALGVIVLNKYIEKESKVSLYIAVILLFYLSGIFKQNAVFLYIGLAIYVLFSKSLNKRLKIKIFLCEFLAGIAVLCTVYKIDGCWYNCITVNSLHSLMSIKEYLSFGISTLSSNFIFIGLACIYLIFLITKKVVLENEIEKMWFAASLGWIIFCMYGAAKEGANAGNMEAAIIAAMPFVLIIIRNAYCYCVSLLNCKKIKDDFQNLKKFKFIKYSVMVICVLCYCAVVLLLGCKIAKNFVQYRNRISMQTKFSDWLNDNYKGKNVAYNTITYEILNNAQVNKTTDFYTAAVWDMGKIIGDSDLKNMSEDEDWDLIITWVGLDDSRWPNTFKNYQKLEKSDYPNLDKYYGEGIEVYCKIK